MSAPVSRQISINQVPQTVDASRLTIPGYNNDTSSEKDASGTGTPYSGSESGRDVEKVPEIEPELDAEHVRSIHGIKWFMVIAAIYSTAFLYGLDNTVVADIQPQVIDTYGDLTKLSWLGSGFPLGSISTLLVLSKIYGIFNTKWLYIASIVLFLAGSALCGAAPTIDTLIVGRVIAGAGGQGMYLGLLNFVAILTTIQERPIYNGLVGLVWGLGTVLGPVVGGGFASSSATWRWAFYINLVLIGVFTPVYLWILPSVQPDSTISAKDKLKRLDYLGALLSAGMWATFVMAFTFGGAQWAWGDHRTIIMFVFFGVILIAFVLQQYFTVFTSPENRVFPGHLLRRRSFVLLYTLTSTPAAGVFVPAYFIPLYFQFSKGDSAIDAAVRLLPFVVLLVTFVMLNGFLMPVFGYYMPWYVWAGVTILIGGSLMHTITPTTSTAAVYGYSILIAVGAGAASQVAYSVAPAKVQPHDVPSAIGFMNHAQIGTIVISLTISGTIFQNVAFSYLRDALKQYNFPEEAIRGAIAGTRSQLLSELNAQSRADAIDAIVRAMGQVYILVIVAGAVTLVTSLFLKREKLFMTAAAA
ncbi:Efflux pump patC [Drechslerella dactyloides]|uniref:Efflux pump patC n=1 Tax=Drechslerella dactyloides TaxID=74499 RepID=A0AAD6IW12_DREDA|nr:Efflux pump patC [Drechslerella dactyloides]